MASGQYSGTTAAKEVPSRRQLLKLAPAAGMAALLAAAVPVIAQAQTETPVAMAYREWAAFAACIRDGSDHLLDDAFQEMCQRRYEMEMAMFDIPSQSVEDVMLKLMAYTDHGNDFMSDGKHTPEAILREAVTLMGLEA